jgi:hypothetical protein
MRTFIRVVLYGLALLFLIAAAIILIPQPTKPFSSQEISQLVDKLNYAAIETPHLSLGPEIRNKNLPLFEKVEKGIALSQAESSEYRELYQFILLESQSKLRILDWQLSALTDYGMGFKNNVGGQGIVGHHDHHDLSSLRNYQALREALTEIEKAKGFWGSWQRIKNANTAYKDMTDIIFHMGTAPQTKSVPYQTAQTNDATDKLYQGMIFHYKSAQFAPVNSPEYVRELHAALKNYDALVWLAQETVNNNLSTWEKGVAGAWLSWRSLAPQGLAEKSSGPFARTGAGSK